ncbi:MAG: sigma-70 family RNA polymerase sigma factor [Acidobacteriia bacterium]|nr:sigma-70 family RNA polymerase sigma factor [Terriglobia bacterium]
MDPDTTLAGNQARFPETRRSAIIGIRSEDPALRACASETLIAAYWKPVYKYVRVRWNQSNEDAKDLTQAFFTRALEKEFFTSYDPSKARFRTYLRACLDAFLSNENKAASRIKRGGDALVVSLDFETAEGEIRHHDIASPELSREEYFHREWVRNLFSLALDDLQRESHERGKQLSYRLFERYDLRDDGEKLTYEMLALEFGITATAVTNHLAAMRRRLRQLVLERIRETTATDKEFRNEVRAVLGIEA